MFTPHTKTRAAGTFLAVGTPEEFFGNPRYLQQLAHTVGRRFARRQKFYAYEDVAQDAAVIALKARARWRPGHRVPFGGFAYKSALLWCTGAMLRASIPVCGCDTRAETEGVRYTSLDAPRQRDGEGATTLGETLDEALVLGARSSRPDDAEELRETFRELRARVADLDDEVLDAVLALLTGTRLDAADIPAGWTRETLGRLADRVRDDLRGETNAAAPETAPAFDPWG